MQNIIILLIACVTSGVVIAGKDGTSLLKDPVDIQDTQEQGAIFSWAKNIFDTFNLGDNFSVNVGGITLQDQAKKTNFAALVEHSSKIENFFKLMEKSKFPVNDTKEGLRKNLLALMNPHFCTSQTVDNILKTILEKIEFSDKASYMKIGNKTIPLSSDKELIQGLRAEQVLYTNFALMQNETENTVEAYYQMYQLLNSFASKKEQDFEKLFSRWERIIDRNLWIKTFNRNSETVTWVKEALKTVKKEEGGPFRNSGSVTIGEISLNNVSLVDILGVDSDVEQLKKCATILKQRHEEYEDTLEFLTENGYLLENLLVLHLKKQKPTEEECNQMFLDSMMERAYNKKIVSLKKSKQNMNQDIEENLFKSITTQYSKYTKKFFEKIVFSASLGLCMKVGDKEFSLSNYKEYKELITELKSKSFLYDVFADFLERGQNPTDAFDILNNLADNTGRAEKVRKVREDSDSSGDTPPEIWQKIFTEYKSLQNTESNKSHKRFYVEEKSQPIKRKH
jgi:hypothetical protein